MSRTFKYFREVMDEFDTGIPLGYECGEVDNKDDLPLGAKIVTAAELKRSVRMADEEDARRTNAMAKQE